MSKFGYISVDVIFAKFARDIKGGDINEGDIIEWIGEAMGFLKRPEIQEEAVAFIEVKDYKAAKPCGFQTIIQIARDRNHNTGDFNICPQTFTGVDSYCPLPEDGVITDCQGRIVGDYEVSYYRPYFDLKYEFEGWSNSRLYKERFTPVRLSDHSFFGSVVAKEKNQGLYTHSEDEYSLKGVYPNMNITLSFKDGFIAVAYLKNAIDPKTGYPLIPDDISFITAISYYIRWKIADSLAWNGREGFAQIAIQQEERWFKYVRQANAKSKMPYSLDDFNNLKRNSLYQIPDSEKVSRFFGK